MRFYSLLKCESSENMPIAYVLPWKWTSDLYYDIYVVKTSLAYPGYETKWMWRAGGLKNIIHGPYKLHMKETTNVFYFTITYMKIKIKFIYK